MLKIILQPEEHAMLLIVQAGLYPSGREPDPLLLRLIALQLVTSGDSGKPRITDLGEIALAWTEKTLH